MPRTYKLSTQDYEMTVEIDPDRMTEEKLHEINQFWGDAEYRLMRHGGDVSRAVLDQLFNTVRNLQSARPRTLCGVVYAFAWEDARGKYKDGIEGWPAMDGRDGITIVACWQGLQLDDSLYIEPIGEAADRRAA